MKRILVSVLGIPLLIVLAWGIRFHLPGPRGPASEPAREGPSAASSSAELDELRTQVKAMERQLSLTQSLLLSQGRVAPATTKSMDEPNEAPSPEETQSTTYHRLDGLLANDTGSPRDDRATEAAIKEDVSVALGRSAPLADVVCGDTFCRVTLEDGVGSSHPSLDLAALAATSKSLRQEALFAYESEGNRRRTIIYLAREGHLLPMPRADSPGG